MNNENLDQYITVSKWRGIAYDEIRKSFIKKNINVDSLHESIFINILAKNSDVQKVAFVFDAYGKFVDMGVGRGWAIGSRREHMIKKVAGNSVSSKPRRRKQFYSRTIFHQGHRLHEIMVKFYGIKMMTTVERLLDGGPIKIPV
jgi:hypothetical protein